MRIWRLRRLLLIAAIAFAGCGTPQVPAVTPPTQAPLRLYATTPTLPLVNQLTAAYTRLNPSVTFEIIAGNFESVYARVQIDRDAYFLTNHLPPESIWAAPIGQDGIAVITHPSNPVRHLTSEQLRNVFYGRISNWRELGGDDRDLIIVTRENGSGTRAEFESLIMGERQTTPLAQIAPSSDAMIDTVARTRGAIGYVSMSYLDSRVRALSIDGIAGTPQRVYENRYPLRAFLYVAGFDEPDSHMRAFVYWMQSPEGQAIIGRRYAPLLEP
jgi:phosphate transport system substrate-binding protein